MHLPHPDSRSSRAGRFDLRRRATELAIGGLAVVGLVLLAPRAAGHGAVYPLPVPSSPMPSPAPPSPTAPIPPGPGFPTTPSNPGPASTGSQPQGPATGGPGKVPTGLPTTGGPSIGPATGGANNGALPDVASWEWWWFYNQDRFLEIKRHVEERGARTTGDGGFFGDTSGATAPSANTDVVATALLEVLARESQPDLVTSALVGLARSCDGALAARAGEFGAAFTRFWSDGSQEVAETAVLARGLVGEDAAVYDLGACLLDEPAARARVGGRAVPARTRAFAAYALGFLGARSRNADVKRYAVHHLVRALHADTGATPDVSVACALAIGLVPLGWSDDASPVMAPATPGAARDKARSRSVSRQTQIEALLAVFVDTKNDRYLRANVPIALARLLADAGAAPLAGGSAVDPALVAEPRRMAARAEVVRVLAAAVGANGEPDEVRQGCVAALGRLGDADRDPTDLAVRAALVAVARDGELVARRWALVALAECGTRTGPTGGREGAFDTRAFLLDTLDHGRSNERAWAALALGLLERGRRAAGDEPSRSVAGALVGALRRAGSPEEASACAIACGLSNADGAVDVVMDLHATSRDPRARGHFAIALGLLGDVRARPALRTQLADARFQPDLLRASGIALTLLGDPEVTKQLAATLASASSQASQSAAATVLGWTGDASAVAPLSLLLVDREASATARAFAATALGRICDRDRLPWSAALTDGVHYRAMPVTLHAGDGTGLLEIL